MDPLKNHVFQCLSVKITRNIQFPLFDKTNVMNVQNAKRQNVNKCKSAIVTENSPVSKKRGRPRKNMLITSIKPNICLKSKALETVSDKKPKSIENPPVKDTKTAEKGVQRSGVEEKKVLRVQIDRSDLSNNKSKQQEKSSHSANKLKRTTKKQGIGTSDFATNIPNKNKLKKNITNNNQTERSHNNKSIIGSINNNLNQNSSWQPKGETESKILKILVDKSDFSSNSENNSTMSTKKQNIETSGCNTNISNNKLEKNNINSNQSTGSDHNESIMSVNKNLNKSTCQQPEAVKKASHVQGSEKNIENHNKMQNNKWKPLELDTLEKEKPNSNIKKVEKNNQKGNVKINVGRLMGKDHLNYRENIKDDINTNQQIDKSADIQIMGRNLRKHKRQNYAETEAESTLESETPINKLSDAAKENTNKIPIYKRLIEDNKEREKSDLYEFNDFDSEKHGKNNHLKLKKREVYKKNKEYKEGFFDKRIHEILQGIEKEEKIKKRRGRKKRYEVSPVYKKTVKNIIEKVMNKVDKKKKTVVFQKDSINQLNESSKPRSKQSEVMLPVDKIQISPVISKKYVIDNDFGFEDAENSNIIYETPQKKSASNRINVINNIVLKPQDRGKSVIESPALFNERRPNANSTMMEFRPESPWRFGLENSKRNPYFLCIKNSALPCIHQDMVLDHTVVKEIDENVSKTSKKNNGCTKKSPVQQSILNFIESNVENDENMYRSNLFDYNDFNSPIKKKSPAQRTVLTPINDNNLIINIENTPSVFIMSNRTPEKIKSVKRNILSPKNNGLEKTPVPAQFSSEPNTNDNTYFGFDNSFDSETNESGKRPHNSKPFRLNESVVRQYPAKMKKVKIKEIPEHIETSLEFDTSNSEMDNGEIQLFEDPETFNNVDATDNEMGKKRRRRRNRVCSSDDEKPRKKKKDVRTKAEDEEAEKWASAFNSMCEEIDQYELEIG